MRQQFRQILKTITKKTKLPTPSQLFQNPNYLEAFKNQNLILNQSGLKVGQEIKLEKIQIDQDNIINSFNILSKNLSKPKILLLHGYMGFGASYYKMLQQLYDKFDIYVMDLPGMGLSSRPDFEHESYQQCLDYFLNSLDKYINSQNIDKFTLVGHSFGGFISSQYALRNPEKIQNLFLLSPLGVTGKSEVEVLKFQQQIERTVGPMASSVLKSIVQQVEKGFTLQHITNNIPTDFAVNQWVKHMVPSSENQNENLYYIKYFQNILKLPPSSDKALFKMFHVSTLTPKIEYEAMEHSLQNFNANTYFYFGDKDWMQNKGAKRLDMKYAEKEFHIVENSGHKIQLDNPDFISQQILSKELNNNQIY